MHSFRQIQDGSYRIINYKKLKINKYSTFSLFTLIVSCGPRVVLIILTERRTNIAKQTSSLS